MRKAHILMVEDEQKVSSFNREYLEGQGYTVSTAETISKARFLLEEYTPDLVLLDVMLPDGLGFDFCAELRQKTNASRKRKNRRRSPHRSFRCRKQSRPPKKNRFPCSI